LILDDFRTGCAVVNLPHFVQAYSGRVVEAMAAGRPVITWEIPDRPRTRELFECGKEILMFPRHSPEQLAAHIRDIQNDPQYGETIAAHARNKVLRCFTTEVLVRRILEWSTGGLLIDPVVTCDEECVGDASDLRYELVDMTDIEMLLDNFAFNIKSLSLSDRVEFKLRSFKRYLIECLCK
jgi:hypothetical protein